jgi:hypothetical protein
MKPRYTFYQRAFEAYRDAWVRTMSYAVILRNSSVVQDEAMAQKYAYRVWPFVEGGVK